MRHGAMWLLCAFVMWQKIGAGVGAEWVPMATYETLGECRQRATRLQVALEPAAQERGVRNSVVCMPSTIDPRQHARE